MGSVTEVNGANGKPRGHFIVVGAGFGGLTAAIELARKGFSVEVVESVESLTTQGDVVQIGSSATRIMSKWGGALETALAESAILKEMVLFNNEGRLILRSPLPAEFDGYPILFSSRGYAQKTIYEYAASIGIKFRFRARVTSYFEDDSCAGVTIGDQQIRADGVIAADGIHSLARTYVIGKREYPRTSGFAVYRCWFPLELLAADPRTKHFTELKEDLYQIWIGTNVHAILLINLALKGAVVFCTHQDHEEVAESWSHPGNLEEMLSVVHGWDETIRTVISLIPPKILVDWKLLWRDPIKKWVSDKGRIVLMGDAAHPHLPTSGSGATQAMEDGATLGALMEKIGSENVSTVFRVFEKLRYERTSLTQRMGWETRHRWHQTDWEFVKSNPEFLKMPQPRWLYGHDAEKYANDRAEEAAASVKIGTTFKSTNVPDDHVHEDWTVESMMALEHKQAEEHFYKIANQ